METSPPSLPEHAELHDSEREKRTHVLTVRARDKDFVVVLSDGSTAPWAQLREVLAEIRG